MAPVVQAPRLVSSSPGPQPSVTSFLKQTLLNQLLLHLGFGAGSALAQSLIQALILQALNHLILAPASIASTVIYDDRDIWQNLGCHGIRCCAMDFLCCTTAIAWHAWSFDMQRVM
jgi:hypothetical protein